MTASEPRRFFRRLICLSHAANAECSTWRWYAASASAGGRFPMLCRSRRLLNQSTHSRVANFTASATAAHVLPASSSHTPVSSASVAARRSPGAQDADPNAVPIRRTDASVHDRAGPEAAPAAARPPPAPDPPVIGSAPERRPPPSGCWPTNRHSRRFAGQARGSAATVDTTPVFCDEDADESLDHAREGEESLCSSHRAPGQSSRASVRLHAAQAARVVVDIPVVRTARAPPDSVPAARSTSPRAV